MFQFVLSTSSETFELPLFQVLIDQCYPCLEMHIVLFAIRFERPTRYLLIKTYKHVVIRKLDGLNVCEPSLWILDLLASPDATVAMTPPPKEEDSQGCARRCAFQSFCHGVFHSTLICIDTS